MRAPACLSSRPLPAAAWGSYQAYAWTSDPISALEQLGAWTCSGAQYFSASASLPNAACSSSSGGNELSDASGWLSSAPPGKNLTGYSAMSVCTWTIKAARGKAVKLTFEALDTEADFDKVYITRGLGGAGGDKTTDLVYSGTPAELPLPPITIPVEDKGAPAAAPGSRSCCSNLCGPPAACMHAGHLCWMAADALPALPPMLCCCRRHLCQVCVGSAAERGWLHPRLRAGPGRR